MHSFRQYCGDEFDKLLYQVVCAQCAEGSGISAYAYFLNVPMTGCGPSPELLRLTLDTTVGGS